MELVRWRTVIRVAARIIIWCGGCGTSGGTDCHASSYRTSTIPIAPSTTVIRATVAAPDCDVTTRAAHRSPAITPDSGSTAIWTPYRSTTRPGYGSTATWTYRSP